MVTSSDDDLGANHAIVQPVWKTFEEGSTSPAANYWIKVPGFVLSNPASVEPHLGIPLPTRLAGAHTNGRHHLDPPQPRDGIWVASKGAFSDLLEDLVPGDSPDFAAIELV